MLPAWQRVMERETDLLGGPQDVSALDLGCGPGFFSMLLARMGCHVDAMDLSPDMLCQAAANADREGLGKHIADELLEHPRDAYTKALIDAVPSLDAETASPIGKEECR